MAGFSSKLTKFWRRLSRTSKLLLGAGVLLIVIVVVNAVWQANKNENATNKNVVAPADVCEQNNDINFSCYKTQLTNITKDSGPEYAFALLKEQYPKVNYVKSQCHQLVHVIGRAAYAKYKDIGDTFSHGDQFCWAGYYHGMMEQVATEQGTDNFLASLNDVCEEIADKARYSFDHYNCVHGIGHGVMEALDGELFQALTACDKVIDGYGRASCYGGVFMQNIMFAQSPDQEVNYTLKYLKNDDPMYPCTAVDDKYKQQCYLMQTSHALQVRSYDFKVVFGLCDETAEPHRSTCYQSLGRDASGQSISDVEQTKAKCLLGKDFDAQSNCIIGAAKDFVSYFHSDVQAKKLCDSLETSLASMCHSIVRSYYTAF